LFLRRKLRGVTDYFALLGQPRQPWLDLEKLNERYYELARTTHPDQAPGQEAATFTEVNRAYRTLRDPKLRLQHLLTLEGRPPSAAAGDIPADLVELFMHIAPGLTSGDEERINALSDALEKSLKEALHQLHPLSDKWNAGSFVSEAEALYGRLSFLMRWRDVLQERRLNMSDEPGA
jgi:curved DNA-binding protein CbpA